ncbi:MAG: hypothetical protein R3A11_05640 [Bdellovibrionota bacterium]
MMYTSYCRITQAVIVSSLTLLSMACTGQKASENPTIKDVTTPSYVYVVKQLDDEISDNKKKEDPSKGSGVIGEIASAFFHPTIENPQERVSDITEIFDPPGGDVDAMSILFSLGLRLKGTVTMESTWPEDLSEKLDADHKQEYQKLQDELKKACQGEAIHHIPLLTISSFDPSSIVFGRLISPNTSNFEGMLEQAAKDQIKAGGGQNVGYADLTEIAKNRINTSFKPSISDIDIQNEKFISFCTGASGTALVISSGKAVLGSVSKPSSYNGGTYFTIQYESEIDGESWKKFFPLYDRTKGAATEKDIGSIQVNTGDTTNPNYEALFKQHYEYTAKIHIKEKWNESAETEAPKVTLDVNKLVVDATEQGDRTCIGIPIQSTSIPSVELPIRIEVDYQAFQNQSLNESVESDPSKKSESKGTGFFSTAACTSAENSNILEDLQIKLQKANESKVLYFLLSDYMIRILEKENVEEWPNVISLIATSSFPGVTFSPTSPIKIDLSKTKEAVIRIQEGIESNDDELTDDPLTVTPASISWKNFPQEIPLNECIALEIGSTAVSPNTAITFKAENAHVYADESTCNKKKNSSTLKLEFSGDQIKTIYVRATTRSKKPVLSMVSQNTEIALPNSSEVTIQKEVLTPSIRVQLSSKEILLNQVATITLSGKNMSDKATIEWKASGVGAIYQDNKKNKKIDKAELKKNGTLTVYAGSETQGSLTIELSNAQDVDIQPKKLILTFKEPEKPSVTMPSVLTSFAGGESPALLSWTDLRFHLKDLENLYKPKASNPALFAKLYKDGSGRDGKYKEYIYPTGDTPLKAKIVASEYNEKTFSSLSAIQSSCNASGLTSQFHIKDFSVDLNPPTRKWDQSDYYKNYKQLMIDQFNIMAQDYSYATSLFWAAVLPRDNFRKQTWSYYLCLHPTQKQFRSFFTQKNNETGQGLWYEGSAKNDLTSGTRLQSRNQTLSSSVDVFEQDGKLYLVYKTSHRRVLPVNEGMGLMDIYNAKSFGMLQGAAASYTIKSKLENNLWNEISLHGVISIPVSQFKTNGVHVVGYTPPSSLTSMPFVSEDMKKAIGRVKIPLLIAFPGNSCALYYIGNYKSPAPLM